MLAGFKKIIVLVAAAGASTYYRREQARNATDYKDPLRYERMTWVGIKVDYLKEPLVAWEIISGSKVIELTGGRKVLTCMDEHDHGLSLLRNLNGRLFRWSNNCRRRMILERSALEPGLSCLEAQRDR